MRLNTQAWSRLDALIADSGADEVLSAICGRISEGEAPYDIARTMGLTWSVLRRWLEEDGRRKDEYEFSKRCFADRLQWEGLRIVMESGVEQVPLARLQSERMDKMSARLDRQAWGDEKASAGGFGSGGITIVIGDVVKELPAPVNVIESVPTLLPQEAEEVVI